MTAITLRSARSAVAVLATIVLQGEALAHGLTDQQWATRVLAYGKACEQLFPEKKAVYSGAIDSFRSSGSGLAPFIAAIEKDPGQSNEVAQLANELMQDKARTERECRTMERLPGK